MIRNLILTAFCVGFLWTGNAQESSLFTGGTVFDGEALHQDWHVLVEGNVIRYAGPDRPATDQRTHVYELEGKTLLPGLIEDGLRRC